MAIVAMTSCSDNDNYEPGPAPAPGCMSVFFEVSGSSTYEFMADDVPSIPVTVKRGVSADAASVPLNVASSVEGGFSVPAVAEFAAGQSSTVINIDCSALPAKTPATITLSIPEEYVNVYAAGSPEISFTATILGTWELWAKDVPFVFSSYYSPVVSDIYSIEGSGKYKIVNFLNSGLDFQFSVDGYHVVPLTNFITYNDAYETDEDAYNCWLLYNEEEQTYPYWCPDDSDYYISTACAYGYDDSSDYTYIDLSGGNGVFYFQLEYADGSWGWNDVSFSFTPLF